MILVSDIAETDQHVGSTLARQLMAERMRSVPTYDIGQSVLDWLDADNRIIVVDGLDRAGAKVRPKLAEWIDNTINLLRGTTNKLVLTSRPESWNLLARRSSELLGEIYLNSGEGQPIPVSVRLGQITLKERAGLYQAYGIEPSRQPGRALTAPSLIRQLAHLQAGRQGETISRADILEKELAALRIELEDADVGESAVPLLLARLQEQLAETGEGWIELKRLIAEPGNLQPAVDYLLRRNLASLSTTACDIRLEPDDVIEAMMAKGLDVSKAISHLTAGRRHPLLMGAMSLMVAGIEEASLDGARSVIKQILDSQKSTNLRLNIIFRLATDLRNFSTVRSIMESELLKFKRSNHLTYGCEIEDFFGESTAPVADLLEIIWILIDGEDAKDWRSLYWFEPKYPGRLITPVTRALTGMVKRSPTAALPFLLERSRSDSTLQVEAATFLLREAALLAPLETLRASYAHSRSFGPVMFKQIMMSIPGPALEFLAFEEVGDMNRRNVAEWAYFLSMGSRPTERPGSVDPAVIVKALDALLDGPWRDDERVILLIGRLSARADDDLRCDLISRWDAVPPAQFWEAFRVAGEGRMALLERFMFVSHDQRRHEAALNPFSPGPLANGELDAIVDLLRRYRLLGVEQEVLVAKAVEWLLFAEELRSSGREAMDELAMEIANSVNGEARLQLIYYAAGASSGAMPAIRRRREALLVALVAIEDGSNLRELLLKLAEVHRIRPEHVRHGMKLVASLGWDRVEAELQEIELLPFVTDYLERLRDHHAYKPADGT
ncbi:MAG: hypothetical protein PGN12_01815 [Sphingomonas phyllosphaerae]